MSVWCLENARRQRHEHQSGTMSSSGALCDRLAQGSVTIMVHTPLDSARVADFAYLRSQEWRAGAAAYQGELVAGLQE